MMNILPEFRDLWEVARASRRVAPWLELELRRTFWISKASFGQIYEQVREDDSSK